MVNHAVMTATFESHPDDDKEDSGPVGVRALERMDPCLLADPYVVSGWVEKRLRNVG
jgi:hypothetical protein